MVTYHKYLILTVCRSPYVKLMCLFFLPKRWLKNEIPLEPSNNLQVQANGQKLIIPSSDSSDSGVYECVVKNEAGTSKKLFNVNVHGKKM